MRYFSNIGYGQILCGVDCEHSHLKIKWKKIQRNLINKKFTKWTFYCIGAYNSIIKKVPHLFLNKRIISALLKNKGAIFNDVMNDFWFP